MSGTNNVLDLANLEGETDVPGSRNNLDPISRAALIPLGFWRLLVVYSRRHPYILPTLFPGLTALTWVLYVAHIFVALLAIIQGSFFGLWPPVFALYGGVNLIHGWVRRRVNPA